MNVLNELKKITVYFSVNGQLVAETMLTENRQDIAKMLFDF